MDQSDINSSYCQENYNWLRDTSSSVIRTYENETEGLEKEKENFIDCPGEIHEDDIDEDGDEKDENKENAPEEVQVRVWSVNANYPVILKNSLDSHFGVNYRGHRALIFHKHKDDLTKDKKLTIGYPEKMIGRIRALPNCRLQNQEVAPYDCGNPMLFKRLYKETCGIAKKDLNHSNNPISTLQFLFWDYSVDGFVFTYEFFQDIAILSERAMYLNKIGYLKKPFTSPYYKYENL